jgi:hypothetical protein
MHHFMQRIAAGLTSFSLALPVLAHEESIHVREALQDLTHPRIVIPVDCQKDPCLDHFGKHEPHWHAEKKEEEDEEQQETPET